jgi:hypothetical protein
MKPGPNDVKLTILIAGDALHELKRFTIDMAEAFGLDRRIEAYSGKRPIGLYRWDLDCLLDVMNLALKDPREYPVEPRRHTRRSNDCVTGCGRNTEGPGNEREARLWLVHMPTAIPLCSLIREP